MPNAVQDRTTVTLGSVFVDMETVQRYNVCAMITIKVIYILLHEGNNLFVKYPNI